MSDRMWHYAVGQERRGPVAEPSLRALIDTGALSADALVWTEGMGDWKPARAALAMQPPPLPGPADPPRAGPWVPGAAPASARPGWDDQASSPYYAEIGPREAVRLAFTRYFDFSGRSNRGEFWWWVLASLLIGFGMGIVDAILFGDLAMEAGGPVSALWSLVTLLPSLALGVRRLHDIGKGGLWLLLWFVPLVGWIVLLVWASRKGDAGPNRFG